MLHREPGTELVQRLTITLRQLIEDEASGRRSQGIEDIDHEQGYASQNLPVKARDMVFGRGPSDQALKPKGPAGVPWVARTSQPIAADDPSSAAQCGTPLHPPRQGLQRVGVRVVRQRTVIREAGHQRF